MVINKIIYPVFDWSYVLNKSKYFVCSSGVIAYAWGGGRAGGAAGGNWTPTNLGGGNWIDEDVANFSIIF